MTPFKIFLIFVLAVGMSAVYVSADVAFNSAINLSNDSQNSREQQVSSSGNNVHVVWTNATEASANRDDIYISTSTNNGTSFGTPINLSSSSNDAQFPDLHVSGSDVYVVWQENATGTTYDILFRNSTDNGSSFFASDQLSSTAANSLFPQITTSGNNVYVVWYEDAAEDEIFFRNSTDNGATFDDDGGNPFTLSDSNSNDSKQPRIAASGSNVYVVWWDDAAAFGSDSVFFRASTNSASSFNSVQNIGNIGINGADIDPQIVTSGSDVYVVWRNGTDIAFTNSTDSGVTFDTPINLSNTGVNSVTPKIAVSGNNLYVVWQENNDDIFLALSTNNGDSFGAPTNISNSGSTASEPQVISSGTSVHVTWRDNTIGNDDVFFLSSPDQGSTLCGVQNLASDDGDSSNPLFAQSNNNVYLTWLNTTATNNDVRFVSGLGTTGCGVTFDANQYKLGDTSTLTVTDPLSNSAPGAIDTVPVTVFSTTDSVTGISFNLNETGINTGVFSGNFTFTETGTSSGTSLRASPSDTITATNTATNDSATASIFPRTFTFDVGGSTVTSFEQNAQPKVVLNDQNSDTTAGVDSVIISLSSLSTSDVISLNLTETGASTGVFNNTKFIVMDGADFFPIDGTVTVSQQDDAPGQRNGGGSNNDAAVETIDATISSDTDSTGITLTLIETGIATNLFTNTLDVVSTPSVSNSSIQTSAGDVVSVTVLGETAHGLVTPNNNNNIGALQVGGIGDTVTASFMGSSSTATISAGTGGGGGGGGVVRPGLVLNVIAGAQAVFGSGGGSGTPPLASLDVLTKGNFIEVPEYIQEIIDNQDLKTPIAGIEGESFDFPFSINEKGYPLGDIENRLVTNNVKIGEPIKFKLVFYEEEYLEHVSIYMNIRDGKRSDQSDTFILYEKRSPLEIVDKNGFFENVDVQIVEGDDYKIYAIFEITFAKPMETSDIVYKSWDFYRAGTAIKIHDAIKVGEFPSESQIIEEIIESPSNKKQPVPDWVKSNAKWWSEGGIDDETFTNGIEYLISEKIIDVPMETNMSPEKDEHGKIIEKETEKVEVPKWVKNNAKWWADDLLPEEDFLNGIKYLIEKGILSI